MPSAKTLTTAMRIASWPLVSSVRSTMAQPQPTPLTAITAAATATTTKASRISASETALMVENTRVISRMGPNSPRRARGEEVGTEASAQLPRVAQNRDESADRGGRHRGPGEHEDSTSPDGSSSPPSE